MARAGSVEVRIVVWESPASLIVPSSAMFRAGDSWSTFVAEDGRAVLRAVEIGRTNGAESEVLSGLAEGDEVVLYPSAAVSDGERIARRVLR